MSPEDIELIATCWTSAGSVAPLDESEVSPIPIAERVGAVAAAGWAGIGLAQDDLAEVAQTIGFPALRAMIADAGLRYTEVELLTDWWETGERRERSDEVRDLLFDAAVALEATQIKIGTAFGHTLSSVDPLVEPLRALAEDAAAHGVRVALEPMPFSMVGSVPDGADLVGAVDHPACGLMVDTWHVFRAGTPLDVLRASLSEDIVFGVELNDAREEVVGTLFEDTIGQRLLCGRGSFDLAGFLEVMRDVGWSGPWGVEIISAAHRALPVDVALHGAFESAEQIVREALIENSRMR